MNQLLPLLLGPAFLLADDPSAREPTRTISAPTLNSEIAGGKGQISGNFTEQEVDAFVNILKAGGLPASLRPRPVSETTVGPKGNGEKKEEKKVYGPDA